MSYRIKGEQWLFAVQVENHDCITYECNLCIKERRGFYVYPNEYCYIPKRFFEGVDIKPGQKFVLTRDDSDAPQLYITEDKLDRRCLFTQQPSLIKRKGMNEVLRYDEKSERVYADLEFPDQSYYWNEFEYSGLNIDLISNATDETIREVMRQYVGRPFCIGCKMKVIS